MFEGVKSAEEVRERTGTTMKSTSIEKAPDSIVARASLCIVGTLNYLSCSLRCCRGRVNDIDNTEDGVTMSTSALNLIETRRRGLEYFGDNNMIDCLPKEMLSHVASFLPPKDFNSLIRTNKMTRSRLRRNDRQPLHITLGLMYGYDDEEKILTVLEVDIYLTTEKGRKWFAFTAADPNFPKGLEKEQMQPVEDWYYNASLGGSEERIKYECGVKEMLSAHLQFLVSNNVVIDRLILEHANELEVDELSIILKQNRMRVNALKLVMDKEVLGDHHMDLIHVCRPTSLNVKNAFVQSTFHDDHVIRELSHLVLFGERIEMKKGDLAAYYSRTSLIMAKVVGVTVEDMKLFVKHWIEATRLPKKLGIGMATEDPESTCNELVAVVDNRLVEVQPYGQGDDPYLPKAKGFHLRRFSDDCHLRIGWYGSAALPDGIVLRFC